MSDMKNKYAILVILVSILFGCSTKEKQTFPPLTIENVSEDSIVITVTYDEFVKTFEDKKRYEEILLRNKPNSINLEGLHSKTYIGLTTEKKIKHETNYLGIQVTPKEQNDFIFGNNIDTRIKSMPMFINKNTQEFDKNLIKPFLESISKNKNSNPYFVWNQHLKDIREERLNDKYEALLHASYITTNTLKEWNDKMSKGEFSIKYITVPYNKYYDSVNPTDEDYLKEIQKRSDDYQIDEKRYIRAVSIPANIHKHFHEKEFNAINRYLETYNSFEDIAKQNNLIKTYSSYYTDNTIPEKLKNFFKSGKKGDTYGPYFEKNSFRALKIVAIDMLPTEAKAQHLVIKDISYNDILTLKKDIERQTKKGKSFLELAKQYSKDYGKNGQWGDLEWFTYGEMVDDFSDSVFMNKPGEVVLANSQYGWHIIKITDHKDVNKKYNFKALYWSLEPTDKDIEATLVKANEFINNLSEHKDFELKASEKGYESKEFEAFSYSKQFTDFKNSHQVYNWAFNAFENDMNAFKIDNKVYVVKLYKIAKPGLMPVFDAKKYLTNVTLNSAVKEYLKDNLDIGKINSLPFDKAATYLNENVFIANDIAFVENSIPKVGTDPYIVGLAATMKTGERSNVIYGNQRFVFIEKLSETDRQVTTSVSKNKSNEWHASISNGRYKYAFKKNDRMTTNLARKQDSYFLAPKYNRNLKNDIEIAEEMFEAELAFINKNYKDALWGTKQHKGFASLIDKSPNSKQQQLLLLYAGLSSLQTGDYQNVINYFSKFETEDRFFSIVKYGAQGDAYSQLGDDQKALEMYLNAEKANDNFVVVPIYLIRAAAIYDKSKDYKSAFEQFNLMRTKYAPSQQNYDSEKYLSHYEYLFNKSKFIVK
jgi:peptidyl-prolyl cis-trans isomerase D